MDTVSSTPSLVLPPSRHRDPKTLPGAVESRPPCPRVIPGRPVTSCGVEHAILHLPLRAPSSSRPLNYPAPGGQRKKKNRFAKLFTQGIITKTCPKDVPKFRGQTVGVAQDIRVSPTAADTAARRHPLFICPADQDRRLSDEVSMALPPVFFPRSPCGCCRERQRSATGSAATPERPGFREDSVRQGALGPSEKSQRP